MSFLRPSALYQLLITCLSAQWMPCQSWRFLRWLGLDGFVKIFIGLLLWSTFSEIRFIPSSSMYPTVRIGDRVTVEKASYYFRNSSIHDIVTFQAPFQVRDGSLYINGIAQNEDSIAEQPKYTSNLTVRSLSVVFLCFQLFARPAEPSLEQQYGVITAAANNHKIAIMLHYNM